VEASKYNLNYIKLDGNVGCMVNGPTGHGHHGHHQTRRRRTAQLPGRGRGASAEQIENAFRILISDANVKAVLINIFGGILRCDRLAEGVIKAVRSLKVALPIVIRMEGTTWSSGSRCSASRG